MKQPRRVEHDGGYYFVRVPEREHSAGDSSQRAPATAAATRHSNTVRTGVAGTYRDTAERGRRAQCQLTLRADVEEATAVRDGNRQPGEAERDHEPHRHGELVGSSEAPFNTVA